MRFLLSVIICAGLSIAVNIKNVYSGPDNMANFLMNEPVSMMDWGCYRLEEYLQNSLKWQSEMLYKAKDLSNPVISAEKQILEASLDVFYDYDKNRIVIERTDLGSTLPPNFPQPLSVIERSKFWIEKVKIHASPSYSVSFFKHNGFWRGRKYEKIQAWLEKVVELQVIEYNNKGELETVCLTDFKSDEIFCKDNGKN